MLKWIGFLLSPLFLWLTFRDAQFGRVLQFIGWPELLTFGLAFVAYLPFIFVRGLYQKSNLQFVSPRLHVSTSVAAVGLSYVLNSIFPAKLGEVFRARFLEKTEGVSSLTILPAIALEKILDLFIILFLFLATTFLGILHIDGSNLQSIMILASVLIGVIAGLLFFIFCNPLILNITQRILPDTIFQSVASINDLVLRGVSIYKCRWQVLRSGLLLCLSWALVLGTLFILSAPFVRLLHLPAYTCVVLLLAQALALSVPSAPGGLGVVHYGLFMGLQLLMEDRFNYAYDIVLAFVLYFHFAALLLDVATGAIWYFLGKRIQHNLAKASR